MFVTTCNKYVQKYIFLEIFICALQGLLCAFVSRLVCVEHAHSLEETLVYSLHGGRFLIHLGYTL